MMNNYSFLCSWKIIQLEYPIVINWLFINQLLTQWCSPSYTDSQWDSKHITVIWRSVWELAHMSDSFHYPDMSTDVIWSQCLCRSDGSVAAICSPPWGSGSCVSHYITGRNNTPVSVVWKWPRRPNDHRYRSVPSNNLRPRSSRGQSGCFVSPLGSSHVGRLNIHGRELSLTVSFFFFLLLLLSQIPQMSLLVDQRSCHIILNEQQKFSSPGDGQK